MGRKNVDSLHKLLGGTKKKGNPQLQLPPSKTSSALVTVPEPRVQKLVNKRMAQRPEVIAAAKQIYTRAVAQEATDKLARANEARERRRQAAYDAAYKHVASTQQGGYYF